AHLRLRRNVFQRAMAVHDRFAVHMLPDEFGKSTWLFLHDLEPKLRACDRRIDLRRTTNDPGVAHQPRHFALAIARSLFRPAAVKGMAEILPFAQNRDPGEPRLESIQYQFLIERPVVIFGTPHSSSW